MPDSTSDDAFSAREGFRPFRDRDRRSQVAVVAGGVLVWAAAYALVVTALGDGLATAEATEAVRARRTAAAGAGAATGLYFGALWTRAHGGPLLTPLYLLAVQFLVPARAYSLGAAPPESLVSTADSALVLVFADPQWILDRAVTVAPGPVVFAVVLAVWAQSLGPGEEASFVERRFPESWRRLRE
ncbi:hypothetical protein [Halorussus marinus]|uniref:hypothetical protein n=1 Tax=Halorussus marinus TaxID=2505976 RepID=UPI00106E7DF0|nr:hypothetical protein [Halorussus marinus]